MTSPGYFGCTQNYVGSETIEQMVYWNGKMNQLSRVGLLLFAPVFVLRAIRRDGKSYAMVLVIIISALSAHVVLHSRIDVLAQQRLTAFALQQESPNEEIADREVAEKASQTLAMRRIGGYVGIVLGIPLLLLLISILFWLLLLGWKKDLAIATSYRLMAHVALPFALRQLLSIPVLWSHQSIDPEKTAGLFQTSLATLYVGATAHWTAYLIDPFWIWMGVLAGCAAHTVGRGRYWSILVGIIFWSVAALVGRSM